MSRRSKAKGGKSHGCLPQDMLLGTFAHDELHIAHISACESNFPSLDSLDISIGSNSTIESSSRIGDESEFSQTSSHSRRGLKLKSKFRFKVSTRQLDHSEHHKQSLYTPLQEGGESEVSADELEDISKSNHYLRRPSFSNQGSFEQYDDDSDSSDDMSEVVVTDGDEPKEGNTENGDDRSYPSIPSGCVRRRKGESRRGSHSRLNRHRRITGNRHENIFRSSTSLDSSTGSRNMRVESDTDERLKYEYE
jgi:hypothetical protein